MNKTTENGIYLIGSLKNENVPVLAKELRDGIRKNLSSITVPSGVVI
jgi:hypothetical protein